MDPVAARAAIGRRLHIQPDQSDKRLVTFQYANGIPITGQADQQSVNSGWATGGETNPFLDNPNVQAYAQMTQQADGSNAQGIDPETLRSILAARLQQSRQQ